MALAIRPGSGVRPELARAPPTFTMGGLRAAHPAARRLPRRKTHWRADARLLGGRDKCLYRRHRRHLFGDMTDALRLGQVYGRNLMGGEEDAIMAVAVARSYCDGLPSEGCRDFPRSAFEQNVVLGGGYRAHDLMLAVFDVRQVVRHCARTWTIALGRHGKVQGLVRPLKVVDLAPGIERALYLVEFVKAFECKQLIGQCAMKALVLASALRVIWPA